MINPIRGRVAQILNSREIAMNIGSLNGVKSGMYFEVLSQLEENIVDPDTGDILGSIERPKVRVVVTKVQEKLSVASTFRKFQENIGGQGNNFGVLSTYLMPKKWVSRYESLKTDEKTWEDLDEEESYVKVGDPVVQVKNADDAMEEVIQD